MKLPSEFEEKMKRLLGDEFPSYIACYEEPRYYGLRVNTKKISVEDFRRICPFKIREVPWIEKMVFTTMGRKYPLPGTPIILQASTICRSPAP